jgi:three-Cys-motif partner protein
MAANPRTASRQGVLRCINVEEKPDVFQSLESATAQYVAAGLVSNFLGSFEANLAKILQMVGDSPVLFFIDPFGTQGAELSTVREIARNARGREVLIRFDDTRVKRLIRLANTQRNSLDPTQQKIAEALARRVAGLADGADTTRILELLDSEERVESRQMLIDGYQRIVLQQTDFRFGLSYPLRNPQTGGHRYFIVHFSAHHDGYVYMADTMAKAERAYHRIHDRGGDMFTSAQVEFPTIQEHFDDQTQAENRAVVAGCLPAIVEESQWHGKTVAAREVFAAIVDRLGWKVLRKEYLGVLRDWKKAGRADFAELDDNSSITFSFK